MPANFRFGVDAKLYRDTSGVAWGGAFSEVKNVNESLDVDPQWKEADSTRRGYGPVETTEPTLLSLGITFKMLEDLNDANFLAFRQAAFTKAIVSLLACSGLYTNNGETYIRGDFKLRMKKSEKVDGINSWEFTAKPCASDNALTSGVTPIGAAGLG